jgi:hypothetical protein
MTRGFLAAQHLLQFCLSMTRLIVSASLSLFACCGLLFGSLDLRAAESHVITSLSSSITVDDLRRHAERLSDDTFEGREAGSRGGHAAGVYIGREFQKHKLAGGAGRSGYYQSFGAQYRNILGLLPGSDPKLKEEVVMIGAHYDHVGYGTLQNSYGPTGFIHNGADDNASGVAGLLEIVEAFAQLETRPKRTILFAYWDGEEKGLLGSKHWVSQPTLPLDKVRIALNMDMIGRLRNDTVEVYGARSGRDLRRLTSLNNRDANLRFNFIWKMRDDSDHFTFFQRGIPVLMLHTGLHDDYHRPSDDPEKLNVAGMHRVVQVISGVLYDLAEQPQLSGFRQASRTESELTQKEWERPLPAAPSRLGLSWDAAAETAGKGLIVDRVARGSAAEQAGIRAGDKIIRFIGQPISDGEEFKSLVLSAENPARIEVERAGAAEPIALDVQLTGKPVRLGISWRVDDAEPNAVVLSRVTAGSPAAQAGLFVNDRIYEVGGKPFASSAEFRQLLSASGPLELLVERYGRLKTISLQPLEVE